MCLSLTDFTQSDNILFHPHSRKWYVNYISTTCLRALCIEDQRFEQCLKCNFFVTQNIIGLH